jgi:hypothetical protein
MVNVFAGSTSYSFRRMGRRQGLPAKQKLLKGFETK